MRKIVLILVCASAFLSSCASIVSRSRWPVIINSAPTGATVTVVNRNGGEVFSGVTPVAVHLRSGSGFFRREYYTLTFKKEGFDPKTTYIRADVNGWYFGNLVFGGLIGLLIVDPATGAMYRIYQDDVQVALTQAVGANWPADSNALKIMSLEEVPLDLREHLVLID